MKAQCGSAIRIIRAYVTLRITLYLQKNIRRTAHHVRKVGCTMNANVFEKANRIIRTCDVAYIGLADENGYPMVSTIATINPESMFEAFFATGIHSNKYKCLLKNKKGSVCYHSGGDNITLIGDIEILFDQQSKSRFWQDDFIEFYTLGATDPGQSKGTQSGGTVHLL